MSEPKNSREVVTGREVSGKKLREAREKAGWKDRPTSSRPSPPVGQGNTPTSVRGDRSNSPSMSDRDPHPPR